MPKWARNNRHIGDTRSERSQNTNLRRLGKTSLTGKLISSTVNGRCKLASGFRSTE
ncbi:hypothetical protein TOT_040000635 [Theileria orientalis strain Shintoku]|uniref:Uncharacterized protein n=1 Tax=Theileria orientalis strain Shintoku TaxID=869250 RepID=J4C4I9_THEOR|nr:hypothetical protein TOT_040000635 [Theileria orientalis strain Shintoku]BAM42266.1 hypothetical protein TOT_040000635 [Theileria orientalis strain Shintoku]|eukprot:XP_009692567.1 hypothetical protein TOT_040000635 [Theileria orientalis strain Shintoku]